LHFILEGHLVGDIDIEPASKHLRVQLALVKREHLFVRDRYVLKVGEFFEFFFYLPVPFKFLLKKFDSLFFQLQSIARNYVLIFVRLLVSAEVLVQLLVAVILPLVDLIGDLVVIFTTVLADSSHLFLDHVLSLRTDFALQLVARDARRIQ
jgi:hypothetical protein